MLNLLELAAEFRKTFKAQRRSGSPNGGKILWEVSKRSLNREKTPYNTFEIKKRMGAVSRILRYAQRIEGEYGQGEIKL